MRRAGRFDRGPARDVTLEVSGSRREARGGPSHEVEVFGAFHFFPLGFRFGSRWRPTGPSGFGPAVGAPSPSKWRPTGTTILYTTIIIYTKSYNILYYTILYYTILYSTML